ncbi:Histone-lysine N-methyltransferase, H3 lysine-9 specific [Grifola frondosa]|uniref:Histone-lysine N-methyltransferase, H3 lysine-9 specific n=1 Tax=Grifola frondosa TaxID=5627 RepID=A0A1C7MST8_GRIFR|nr:Histone-lysine N-methyltransferase, H3 lysine-9 specific [Grifola frondosa]
MANPIWMPSSPEPEEWDGDADTEWTVRGIVSEETDSFGIKRYEASVVLQYSHPEHFAIQKDTTAEISHGYRESKRQGIRARLRSYMNWDDIPNLSDSESDDSDDDQSPDDRAPLRRHNTSTPTLRQSSRPQSSSAGPTRSSSAQGNIAASSGVRSGRPSQTLPTSMTPTQSRLMKSLPRKRLSVTGSPSVEDRQDVIHAPIRYEMPRRTALQAKWTSKLRGAASVTIINNFNAEDIPPSLDGFEYRERDYLRDSDILQLDAAMNCLVNCECETACENAMTCECQGPSELKDDSGRTEFAYTKRRLFKFNLPQGVEVIECNKYCSCNKRSCPNRVAQLPRDVPIEVFRTPTCGWGARAAVNLAKGKVVGIYTGELIRREEADRRTGDSRSYIFDLDMHEDSSEDDEDSEKYSVDSSKCGNWTRFINHSCSPNMRVYPVVWDTIPEMNQPYLAFVATEAILARTELTIDYDPKAGAVYRKGKTKGKNKIPAGAVKCVCGAEDCRGWVRV